MNDQLHELYTEAWEALNAGCARRDGAARPHLIRVPDAYTTAPTRLAIVGQEVGGWAAGVELGDDPVDALMRHYAAFDLGRGQAGAPFWDACHELHAALNPNGPPRAFVWSSLVKVDAGGDRSGPALEDPLVRLGLPRRELELLRPDAVVFFTGPRYDPLLAETFPGLVHEPAGLPFVSRLVHPALPGPSFRCYDPAFLHHRGSSVVLGRLRDVLIETVAA